MSKKIGKGLVAFLHIPKTAGTTLYSIIAHQYSPDEVCSIHDNGTPKQTRRFKAILKQQKDTLRLIHGHIEFSWSRLLPAETQFFTILRHPVERAISHYYQYRRATHEPLHKLAMRTTLLDWVSNSGLKEMDNGMTRRLAGQMDLPLGAVSSATLDQAKANLANRFSVVGLTERFDETQILLHRAFNWPYYRYPARNVGDNRGGRAEIGNDVLATIEQHNRFDLELYKFASELFEQAVSKLDMATELAMLSTAGEHVEPPRPARAARAIPIHHRAISGLKSFLAPRKVPKLMAFACCGWWMSLCSSNLDSLFAQL